MNIKITSCIVLYKNDISILRESIDSFLDTKLNVILFLIDNSPTDLLNSIIIDPRVKYFHNPSNPGFGASHNIAIKEAIKINSDFHLVLNPDIYFETGVLEKLCDFMEKNLDIGHLMPKITYPNGDLQYLCKKNPTFFDLFFRSFAPTFLKKMLRKRMDIYEYKNHDYEKIIYNIPYLSGCFMFLRTKTLKNVGFFDDKIFMYLEDADLTRRFMEISQTVYYPLVKVNHHFAKLTHKQFKYKWITIQSAFIYFNKWGWLKSIY